MKKKNMTVEEALKILETAPGKDFYTIKYQDALNVAMDALREKLNTPAHWIYSGDDEDYDGYYMNCSKCGAQRKVYDRDCDLDIPVACPHCGVAIDTKAWEVQERVREKNPDKFNPLFRVVVIYDNGKVARPYTMTTRAKDEDEAKDKAITDVLINWIHDTHAGKDVYVDSVEVFE